MGYFDGIVDGSFKTTDDGVLLYFPFGVLGKGYAIPNEETKQDIRKSLKRFYIILLPLIIVAGSAVISSILIYSISWLMVGVIGLLLVIGLSLISYFVAKGFTKGLTPVGNKLTVAESYQNSAKSHNTFTLVALELVSFLFVLVGVKMLLDNQTAWYFRVNGAISILLFSFASIAFGYMIKVKMNR